MQTLIRGELPLEAPTRRRRRMPLLGLSAATLLTWSLASSPLAAQPPYEQEHLPGFTTLQVDSFSNPALVDLDGDGDLDEVVGGRYGTLETFENTGGSSAPAFVPHFGMANPFDGYCQLELE